jgi:DNA-binding response OmpR family regulator
VERILLCTFDPLLRKALQGPLMDAGYRVDTADYPADAIRHVMHGKFKAVVLDSGGIGLDAPDAAVIIRRLSDNIRIIVLGDNGPAPNIHSNPDIYSLEKPVDMGKLKRILAGVPQPLNALNSLKDRRSHRL